MGTLEQMEKVLKTKLGLLCLTNESTVSTLSNGKLTAIERQRKTLREKVDEVHEIKVTIQEKKLEQEVEYDVVRQWTTETEESLGSLRERNNRTREGRGRSEVKQIR